MTFGYTTKWDYFFSSDTQALAWQTENIIFLNDGDIIHVTKTDFSIKSDWKLVNRPTETIDIANLIAEKWDYKHFMLKEIFE